MLEPCLAVFVEWAFEVDEVDEPGAKVPDVGNLTESCVKTV
ncbi:MAG: hypothetical protein QM736_19250 [Vicinamibacterales bacterium]